MAALACNVPRLPGAACVRDPELHDPRAKGETRRALAARQERAIAVCQWCSSLADCTAWLERLDLDDRPAGTVTAGRIVPEVKPPTEQQLKRLRMLELLAAEPDATHASIAARAGVDHSTVRAARRRLAAVG
jgi:hypothetical protein